ncbi:hypothetical protein D9619_008500 [Psilocybe cf. subviscida]|uniref:Uncharacterized protein n=1 Tax=Psilocybe cf. subviscida TaxID=2480587 RepID=A0A8H5BA20_9AGAR|nr:hypothetical protein D9619_008500 [Psilocybe cf. subviscida]
MPYYPTFGLSSAVVKMFRRLFQSIKNYIQGPPQPQPTEEMMTQKKDSSQGIYSGRLASSVVSSGKVKSHCPIHDPIVNTVTAPLTPCPGPETTSTDAFNNYVSPPPYVETHFPRRRRGSRSQTQRCTSLVFLENPVVALPSLREC